MSFFFIAVTGCASSLATLRCISFLSQAVASRVSRPVLPHRRLVVVVIAVVVVAVVVAVVTRQNSFAPEQCHDYVGPCALYIMRGNARAALL